MDKFSFRHQLIPGLTFVAGIVLSVMATLFVEKWEATRQQTRFQRQIESLATVLQRNLNRYTDVLAFLRDHYTVTQGEVKRQEFTEFVARSMHTYPGIQALEWAPLVHQAERGFYEKNVRAEGYTNFQITELSRGNQLVRAGERSHYIPVIYIVPFSENEAAFGFDLNSNPARAAAIASARDQGKVMATGRIRLVQERRDQFGFLVVLPLYKTAAAPATIELRQQQFAGILLGVFRISDVIEEALQGLSHDVDFVLYDQSAVVSERFLGRYDAANRNVTMVEPKPELRQTRQPSVCGIAAECTRTITVGQRQWQAVFSPAARYPASARYGAASTLFLGLLLTGSLVLFLHNLNTELAQTKRLSDLKLRFFSMASHELRTPLSTILLSAESLQINVDELTEPQKQANIQRIHSTAKQMTQQIADLLILTRAEAGKLEFHPELLDLKTVCQQAIEAVEVEGKPRILFTDLSQNPCQDTKIFWDRKLTRSLLTNLLSNALKYSPEHSMIRFTVGCDGQTATLQICDSGIGIPASDQPHIKEAFHRASNVGEIVGTGLGLAIVETCVQLHRGEWTIASQEGEGTCVTVRLPLE